MIFLSFLVTSFGVTTNAFGKQLKRNEIVQEFSWNFHVSPGELETKNFDGLYYVSKVVIRAEGIRRDGTVEVYANGENVGTIYAPGSDPSYTVTVKETINSLEFRHVSGSTVKIRQIHVYGKPVHSTGYVDDPGTGYFGPSRNVAASIASRAIELVEMLQEHTRWAAYGEYLLPIKKVAARALSMSRARGSLSSKVRTQLLALAAQIDHADQYITDELSRSSVFDMFVEMKTLRNRIYDSVD